MPLILERPFSKNIGQIEKDPGLEYFQAQRTIEVISLPDTLRAKKFLSNSRFVAEAKKPYKIFQRSPKVFLKPNLTEVNMPLSDAMSKRRTIRNMVDRQLSFTDLSNLLLLSYGEKKDFAGGLQTDDDFNRRTSASPGGLYPLEIYVAALNVDGLDQALFHFNPRDLCLEKIKEIPLANELKEYYSDPIFKSGLAMGCALIFITAIFERTVIKYGRRGWKLVFMEAGHLNQNLYLATCGLGLAYWPQGGIKENRITHFLGIDGLREGFLLSGLVGHIK